MYSIKLQDFEGPLDLLLFFIKRDELDVYDIPIARITREFLEYLHYMEALDLEVAGEFLVMAAELMQIKARLLLPPEEGAEEELDPRANLISRLVEYKRFKEMSEHLSKCEEEAALLRPRGYRELDPKVMAEEEEGDLLRDVTLFDLIASFRFAMERMPKKSVHEIIRFNVTIEEQTRYIREFFSKRSEATFAELVEGMEERLRIVVTFLALLELIRSGSIIIRQKKPFTQISIMRAPAA